MTTADEIGYDLLRAEWNTIQRAEAANVADWIKARDAMEREERDLRRNARWVHGPTDAFGVLRLGRDEVSHSAMLAWLLDPCARHGLGTLVLEGVMRAAFDPEVVEEQLEQLALARTRCEVTRGDCRIDILVQAPKLTLVIENKVDAEEGHRQCDAYFELFQHDPGPLFIFLTPDGRRPESATGAAERAFKVLGYDTVRSVLERSVQERPEGGAARHLVHDYLRTLRREFR